MIAIYTVILGYYPIWLLRAHRQRRSWIFVLPYGIMLQHFGFGTGLVLANVCGYLTGALMSYALNRSFTFASDGLHAQTLPRFGIAVAVCFGLNLLVLKFCISVLALPVAAAQALAMGTYTVAFYLISRYLVFRS